MNSDIVIKTKWTGNPAEQEELLKHEWLVTNGLGGYASGTISGVPTRRFHSLLTASLSEPQGRYVMLNQLSELVRFPDGSSQKIGGIELADGSVDLHGMSSLREFRLESGMPVWRYELANHVLEKSILMPYMTNTVHVGYRLVSGTGPVRLKIRVAVHFRRHDASLAEGLPMDSYDLKASAGRIEIQGFPIPPLRLYVDGENPAFTIEAKRFSDILYRIEQQRGYEAQGNLWSPVYYRADRAGCRNNAYPCNRRRCAYHHCRLPLVYRLGARHHDQSGGPDAEDRTANRGGAYSAYFCPSSA